MPGDDDTSNLNNNELAIQLANMFKTSINNQHQKQNLSDGLKISLKLNSQNYALWARMMRVAIGGKSKSLLSHLTGKPEPPKPSDEEYEQWEQNDLIVFSWLIQNIEPNLASNLTEFPTAKTLWDALVVTYSSGKDKLQTFDLHVKSNEIKQKGTSLEDFWITLQGIWGEIERIEPNPMTCAADIATYNKLRSEHKLFQFLNALDKQFDPIKREILRWDPLPSAEEAYAAVRKEMAHQGILGVTSGNQSSTTDMASGLATNKVSEPEVLGLISRAHRRPDQVGKGSSSSRIDKSRLKCSHCGMSKHTKEQCFKIVGYPDWWNDGHRKGGDGKAAAVVGGSEATTSGGGDDSMKSGGAVFGFGAVAARYEQSGEEGYQDGNDHWAWH